MRANWAILSRLVLGCAVALYIAVRLWRLTESCFWFDEIFSVHAAGLSWAALLDFTALDLIHPPLFYLFLKLWMIIGGESLFWLRLFPVFWSVLAIFPLIFLGRELKFGVWERLLAIVLFAVNGSLIKYAQEVRMYAPLMCLSLFSLWIFARYFIKGKSFWPLVAVNLLMIYTHYFGWFLIAGEVLLILWRQPVKRRKALAMFAMLFAAFLPWMLAVFSAARAGSELSQNIGWMSRPSFREISTFIFNLIEPFYYRTSTAEPISIFIISIPLLLIVIASAIFAGAAPAESSAPRRENNLLLAVVFLLPIIGAFTLSWLLPNSIWGTRHLIIVFAPAILLIATAVCAIKFRAAAISVAACLILLSAAALAIENSRPGPQYSWCAWGDLAVESQSLSADAPQTRRIVATEQLIAYHLWFATRDFPQVEINYVRDLPGVEEDKAYFLPRGFDSVKTVKTEDLAAEKEFWLAFRDSDHRNDTSDTNFTTYTPGPIRLLQNQGLKPDAVIKRKVGREFIFFVRMKK